MGTGKKAAMLGAAMLIALLASALVYSRLEKMSHAQAGAARTQPAVIAAIDLPWGAVIDKGAVKAVPFLKKSLPAGAFAEPSEVEGRTLIGPLKAGELVLESRLAPTSLRTGGVAAIITPKKRAMAVRVDKIVGVSGFIRPGHRVDVLVTLSQTGESRKPVTKTVLENVLVLAAGADLEKGARPEKPSQVDVITLEVTPEDGEKLALAATEGKLQLALRNGADNADVMTRGSTFRALLASYGACAPEGPAAAQSTRKTVAGAAGAGANGPAGIRSAAPWAARPQLSVELVKGTVLSSVKFDRRE